LRRPPGWRRWHALARYHFRQRYAYRPGPGLDGQLGSPESGELAEEIGHQRPALTFADYASHHDPMADVVGGQQF
jgi:hypothetical protein